MLLQLLVNFLTFCPSCQNPVTHVPHYASGTGTIVHNTYSIGTTPCPKKTGRPTLSWQQRQLQS